MRRHELAVQQGRTGATQRRYQPAQRHFRRIGLPREHAFAAEYPVEADAVEPAYQFAFARFAFQPDFDRMGMAQCMKAFVAGLDAMADPAPAFVVAVRADAARRGAGVHDLRKGGVAGDREASAPQGASERMRHVEAIERKSRAEAWLDPEDFRIVAAVRHRKNSAAIGQHQEFRLDRGGGAGGVHVFILKGFCGIPS